jgi:pSer/pThr/pTyr-binding forkhead associated (FHA) protein
MSAPLVSMQTFPILLDIYRRDDDRVELVEQLSLLEPGSYTIGRRKDNDIHLDAIQVSRQHAVLIATADGLQVKDRASKFGTFIGPTKIEQAAWSGTAPLRIEPFEIRLVAEAAAPRPPAGSIEVATNPRTQIRVDEQRQLEADREMRFPRSVFKSAVVPVSVIRASGHLQGECDYLTVGGGIGSFVWVDHLRVFGVPAGAIRVVGDFTWNRENPRDLPRPYENYSRLCRNSQIPDHERLRSNSISTPDNIWGFPGYASRETWRELKRLGLGGLRYIFQVFGEPAIAQSYTPRSGDVFRSIDREAFRIGWRDMCIPSRALALRKTDDGRYAVAFRIQEEHSDGGLRDKILIARHVHLASGYPAYRTEDDIFKFNQQHYDEKRAFKAYDQHETVYQDLEQRAVPATVVVRGRGIVASRILQRLYEARRRNGNIQIYHQMRRALGPRDGSVFGWARRPVFNNTEYQPFNWPKASWGGELRRQLERAGPERRSQIFERLGGTSTANRLDWRRIVQQGTAAGWYRVVIGRLDIKELAGTKGAPKLLMTYSGNDTSFPREILADYVIDCIGLIGDVANSEFLRDMIETYQLPRNRDYTKEKPTYLGIAVSNDYEILGLRNGNGHVYAAGQITGHGPYAAVDSFLGLQYCALRSVDHLHAVGASGVSRLGALHSFRQWLRWCRNATP